MNVGTTAQCASPTAANASRPSKEPRLMRPVIFALALLAPAAANAAPATVKLSVRYPASSPTLTLTSTPELAFRCTKTRVATTCVAPAPKGTTVALRARTVPAKGSGSVSAASLPIADDAWGGACMGVNGDVCRVDMVRARLVDINYDKH